MRLIRNFLITESSQSSPKDKNILSTSIDRCSKHIESLSRSWRSCFSHQIGPRAGTHRQGLAAAQKNRGRSLNDLGFWELQIPLKADSDQPTVRWRTVSNKQIPAATETFRLSTVPSIGILAKSLQRRRVS